MQCRLFFFRIQVILRVRPLNDREISLGSSACVLATSPTALCVKTTAEAHSFAFDVVADADATQEHIYKGVFASVSCSVFS